LQKIIYLPKSVKTKVAR